MSYKCRICGLNEVEHQEDVCELCAVSQDPYAASITDQTQNQPQNNYSHQGNMGYSPKRGTNRKILLNGGSSLANTDPYGNNITPDTQDNNVQVFSAGQTPQVTKPANTSIANTKSVSNVTGNQPITSGITKNIMVDNQKKSILAKWFRSLFSGIPFTIDNDITMFQVFPDFTGTSLNAQGNACDQVVVYGKLNNGAISENNDVEVFGRRDSNNNIIAKTIRNKASGTTITPIRTMSTGVVWIITLIFLSIFAMVLMELGIEGIIWIVVIIMCLANFPKILKIIAVILGVLFSFFKKLF